ncbi:hypothetical protein RF11_09611 [Thelohanellus kitauei]|uniref:Uncharacterized protein n=1 Tax=Thelohanellus kitauei TaxID=669202 RepID=A0A0C2MMZ1_THEKT|nr:hypothetical protein RF11_09611 [Thelohanellus kitauei]
MGQKLGSWYNVILILAFTKGRKDLDLPKGVPWYHNHMLYKELHSIIAFTSDEYIIILASVIKHHWYGVDFRKVIFGIDTLESETLVVEPFKRILNKIYFEMSLDKNYSTTVVGPF